MYDGLNIIAEYDQNNQLTTKYVQGPGIDEHLSMQRSGSVWYYRTDGLGSLTAMTDSAGTVVQSYTYDSFGNIVNQTGSIQQPYTYTGREYDSETGLYYYRARYYDTITGRFISKDPIGLAGGINLYAYVGNNPINRTDPSGLQAQCNSGCQSGQSGAFGNCVSNCMNKWLVSPATYTYSLITTYAVISLGNTPVVGGATTAAQYGGAMAGAYIGAKLAGISSVEGLLPWVAGGAAVGNATVVGASVVGAAAAGWAIGTVVQCTASCAANPCSY